MTHFRSVVADLISKKRKHDQTSSNPSDNQEFATSTKVTKVEQEKQHQSEQHQTNQTNTENDNTAQPPNTTKNKQETNNASRNEQDTNNASRNEQARTRLPSTTKQAETKLPSTTKQAEASSFLALANHKAKIDEAEKELSKQAITREYSCERIKFFVVRINQLLSILSQIVSSKSYANQIKVGLARTKFNSEFCNVPDTVRAVWNMTDQQKEKAQAYMSVWHKAASTKVDTRDVAVHDVLSNECVPAIDAVNIIVAHIPVLKTVGLDEMALGFEPDNLVVLRKLLVNLCSLAMHTK